MKECIKLMRPKHYIKNILIFVPLVFSNNMLNLEKVKISLLAFVIFCLTSSIIYVINDIKDVESDKKHPTKKNRPIASGKVSVKLACVLAVSLFIIVMGLNYFLSYNTNILMNFGLILLYIVLNILYSCGLKNKAIVDIVILASGFLIRVLYGSSVINVEISNWLYLTVIFGAFYIGLGKRRNEIDNQGTSTRKVLKYYNRKFLDKNMYVCLALSIVFYSLWTVDISTISRVGNNYLIWTVPLVMIIFMKYSLNIEGDSFGDPVDVILSDKSLIILIILYILLLFSLIYLI